jgi:hypothetical protein
VSSSRATRVQAWLLGLCAAAAAGAQALRVVADPDLWWHLRTGQWILERHSIPAVDPFSFTAAGAPWTNHEWLTEVIFAAAFEAGGGAALTALRAALLFASAGILAWLLHRRTGSALLAALLVAMYVPLFATFWNVRAQTFSYFLTLATLAILEILPRRPGAAWILPALLALWVNLHGGFLLGLLTAGLGILTLATGVETPPRGRPLRPAGRTWALLGLLAAAPLLNPQGWRIIPYLVRELSARQATVREWRRLSEAPGLWPWFLGLVLQQLALLLAAPGVLVLADEDQLWQAVLNLIRNAMEAMSGGGRLEILTRADGDGVTCTIADNGAGMTTDVIDQMFRPFFSTKRGGTGLGMPFVRQVLTEHESSLKCTSVPGRGTRFTFTLASQEPHERRA